MEPPKKGPQQSVFLDKPYIYIVDPYPRDIDVPPHQRHRYCDGEYSKMEIQPYVDGEPFDRPLFPIDVGFIRRHLSTVGDGLAIRPSTIVGAGLGLFATETFMKTQIVTYYWGLVLPYREVPRDNLSHARSLYPLAYTIIGNRTEGDGRLIVEPLFTMIGKGGGAYINGIKERTESELARVNVEFLPIDSQEGQQRQLAVPYYDETRAQFNERTMPLPHNRLIGIRAIKHIEAGEELYLDYGEDYWKRESQKDRITRFKRG